MSFVFYTIVSTFASVSSVIVLIPQLYLSFSKNNTDGLSIYFLLFQSISALSWLLYAVLLKEIPMLFSESIYTMSSLTLLTLKLFHIYKKKYIECSK